MNTYKLKVTFAEGQTRYFEINASNRIRAFTEGILIVYECMNCGRWPQLIVESIKVISVSKV